MRQGRLPGVSGGGYSGRWWWGSAPPRTGRRSSGGRLLAIPIFLAAVAALALLALSPAKGTGVAEASADLTIVKKCSAEAPVGAPIQYRFDIKNVGTESLNRVSVGDTVLEDIGSLFPASLGPSDSATVFMDYLVEESDHPGPLVNVVTATYETAGGAVAEATADCSTDIPHMTLTKTLTVNANSTFTFTITNDGDVPLRRFRVKDSELGEITSFFPSDLAVGETVEVKITVLGQRICDNEVHATYQSVPRGLAVFAFAECGVDEFTFLDAVQRDEFGNVFNAEPITFHVCEGDVVAVGCDGASPTNIATSKTNPSGLIPVANPGIHTVCVVEPTGFQADEECKAKDVLAGSSVTFTFITTPVGDGEGCTPGFWKNKNNGRKLWDQASDAIPIAIGAALGIDPEVVAAIDPASDFYLVFMVDPETAGLPADPFTTDDAIRAGGKNPNKLTRSGMAALLNAASVDVNYPKSIIEVKNDVQNALITENFEPLATDLDDFNNLSPDCPADD